MNKSVAAVGVSAVLSISVAATPGLAADRYQLAGLSVGPPNMSRLCGEQSRSAPVCRSESWGGAPVIKVITCASNEWCCRHEGGVGACIQCCKK